MSASSSRLAPRLAASVMAVGLVALLLAGLLRDAPPVAAQACSWTGTWRSSAAGATVTLMQSGNQVTGDDGNSDQINGTVTGNRLTGRWTHGGDSGAIDWTMDASCNSFTGTFGSNSGRPADSFSATRLTGASAPPATS